MEITKEIVSLISAIFIFLGSILVAVVLAMGIAAPVVLKVTDNATNLNMKEHVFQENVNSHLKEVEK